MGLRKPQEKCMAVYEYGVWRMQIFFIVAGLLAERILFRDKSNRKKET